MLKRFLLRRVEWKGMGLQMDSLFDSIVYILNIENTLGLLQAHISR